MALTLSGIRGWTPDHLTQVADYFTAQANQSEDVFTDAHSQLMGMTWDGQGGTGARGRSGSNLKAVRAHASELRATAKTMHSESEAIANARNEVLAEVARFKDNEFTTDESFIVHDAKQSQSPQMQTIRQLYAQEYTGQLATKVAAFEAATAKAAGTIGEHTTELAGFSLPAWAAPGSGGDQPFLPKWQQAITSGSPAPEQPPLTLQTPNGPMQILPPASDFPARMTPDPFTNLRVPGMPPAPPGAGLPDGIRDGVHNGLPALTPPSPVTPIAPSLSQPGTGKIRLVDNDTPAPTPTPNPWTGPGGVWDMTPANQPIGPPGAPVQPLTPEQVN